MRIRRKGYWAEREGKRYYVSPTTFYIEDRGAPGRGKKYIEVEDGHLVALGYSLKKGTAARREALKRAVGRYGYLSTKGKVWALVQFFKRTEPEYSRRAREDFEWLVREFGRGG